jgi:membrane peptidoglycan carboxypeptidase
VRTVLNHDGSVRAQHQADTKQVFSPDVMADATYAMTQVVERGTAKAWIKPLDRPIAGKTGTTDLNVSALFAGFTPHISTVVSLRQYGEDGTSRVSITPFEYDARNGVVGGTIPAHVWADYMAQVFKLPQFAAKTPFPERAYVGGKPAATTAPTPTDTPTPEQTQPATVKVPSGLVGRLQADASAALFNAGLQPQIKSAHSDDVGIGRVISVSPREGASISPDEPVTLVISTGPKNPATQRPTASPTTTAPSADQTDAAGSDGDGDGADDAAGPAAGTGKGDDAAGPGNGGGSGGGGTTKG